MNRCSVSRCSSPIPAARGAATARDMVEPKCARAEASNKAPAFCPNASVVGAVGRCIHLSLQILFKMINDGLGWRLQPSSRGLRHAHGRECGGFVVFSAANSGGELILPPTTRPIWNDLGGMAGNLFIYFLAKETPGPSVQWCTASEAQASESPVVGSSPAPLQSPGSERPLRSDYGSWASGRPSDSGSHPCDFSSWRGASTSGCPLRNNTEHRPPVAGH